MAVNFTTLWSNYPNTRTPCSDPYANQCAIRLSIALESSSFPLVNYTDPVCSHGHARGAESLANHLWRRLFVPRKISSTAGVSSSQGIIFFKDIAGFRGGIGDHIDLWNQGLTKTGDYAHACQQIWFWGI